MKFTSFRRKERSEHWIEDRKRKLEGEQKKRIQERKANRKRRKDKKSKGQKDS